MHTPHPKHFIRHQLQAYRNWLEEQDARCHLLVNLTQAPQLLKEQAAVSEYGDKIGVLSIGSKAADKVTYHEDCITFMASSRGAIFEVTVPYELMIGVRDPEIGMVYLLDCSVVNMSNGEPGILIHIPMVGVGEEPPKDLQAPKERPKLTLVK